MSRRVDASISVFRGPLPGMAQHPETLAGTLAEAYRKHLHRGYQPRTHHVWPNKSPKYHNRLLLETSPYLLQHAHNPVNWYPWGKEAFARAKRENKPVFLSVGYSTCHWCHVMEKESFESPTIAAYLNQHYIAVKVDREERLDIDGIYMKAVQIFSQGGGGWPMSVWLTPTQRPFFAGTYFPPTDRWGRRGFLWVLQALHQEFQRNPLQIANRAYAVSQHIHNMGQLLPSPGIPAVSVFAQARRLYQQYFDPVHGGMRGRPKFPSSFGNAFLMRYHRRTQDSQALAMAIKTLEKMAHGGIYDQVGGGFHRYSTDAQWLVPHFEKMLYDNALLAALYTEAFQLTQQPLFSQIAQQTLDYVIREMTSPQGGFYSATDADSEGHEGKFFVWTAQEVDHILGQPLSGYVKAYWGVSLGPNFEGRSILHVPQPLSDVASLLKVSPQQLVLAVTQARQRLYAARQKRIPPLLDNKIITSWNGLMISALARAAFVFQRPDYAQHAMRAAQFLLRYNRKQGRLLRTYRDGQARFRAYLEDYAFLQAALLDLFDTTQDMQWFREALQLQQTLHQHYWDQTQGGYFQTSQDHEKLMIRPKPNYDGAVPTGNSVQIMNLLRFHTATTQLQYYRWAEQSLRYFGQRLTNAPLALSEMLLALEYYYDAPKEIILIKPHSTASVEPFLQRIRRLYLPNRIILVATEGRDQQQKSQMFPQLNKKVSRSRQVTAYVCMKQVCELPTTDPVVFEQQLRKVTPLANLPSR